MNTPNLRICAALLTAALLLVLPNVATGASAPDITSFESARVEELTPGTELSFRVTGTPGVRATVRVPGIQQPIRLDETRPGVYEGYYTIRRADKPSAQGQVRAVLRHQNVTTTSTLERPLVASRGRGTTGRGIQHFTMEPGAIEPGVEVTFRVHGVPGGKAAVDLGDGSGRSVGLTEVQPGIYEGMYTVRRQDRFNASTVSARLQADNRTARARLGAAATTAQAPALTTIEFTSPPEQSQIGNAPVEVRGRSAPNTTLNAHVNAKSAFLGPLSSSNLVFARQVRTDSRGDFSFTFEPKEQNPGTRYEVLVSGAVAGQEQQKMLTLMRQ